MWFSHSEMMQEIASLRFQRAIVPKYLVSFELNTIDVSDASNCMSCVAVYARLSRRNGTYSSQLVLFQKLFLMDLGNY